MVRVHFGPPLQLNKTLYGGLAQLGERLPCKQEVTGSIPVLFTNKRVDSWQLTVKELTEVPWKWDFIEFLERETQNAPWKLNIESIMMQLWEQQLREIFYNWVIIIQFCKYLLLMSLHNSTNLRTNIGLFSVSWTDHREDESRVIEVKLIRAQGECLGIRSRWRTWKAAISYGELQMSVDP